MPTNTQLLNGIESPDIIYAPPDWPTKTQAVEILGLSSERRLNELFLRLRRKNVVIQELPLPPIGFSRSEVCVNPADLERVRVMRAQKQEANSVAAFRPYTPPAPSVGPQEVARVHPAIANEPIGTLGDIARLLVPRPRLLGTWMSVENAARRYHLSARTVRKVARWLIAHHSNDAYQDGCTNAGLRIRYGALDSIGGEQLREIVAEHKAAATGKGK